MCVYQFYRIGKQPKFTRIVEIMALTKNINYWSAIYRGLGNQNRLKIIQILHSSGPLSVGEIAEKLKISFKNTSRNLKILADLGFLVFEGRKDRVYYDLNQDLPQNIKQIFKTIHK